MIPTTWRRSEWVPASAHVLPAVLLVLLMAAPLAAQRADFLFNRPKFTLSLAGGWAIPGEGGDLFQEARQRLTVSQGDFAAPSFMVEAGIRLTERLDLAVGFEQAESTVHSEMRNWVTLDDRPIPQTTQFDRRRLMVSAKAYLFERGRRISRYAWVPNAWSPYLGGGVGATWYEYLQNGDFVDYLTRDILELRLRSTGRGLTRHAMAGLDISLGPSFLLRGEYRYVWATAPVDQLTFQDFGDIDLSGARATLGFAVRL